MKQAQMFTDGQDLPLFSGTPQSVSAQVRGASTVKAKQSSFFKCSICSDTGRIKQGRKRLYCWCEAGDAARWNERTAQ